MKILEERYQRPLLIRLRSGDRQAFTELYEAYSKPLYYRILRLVKDNDIADELLQELFIKIWERRATLDIDRSFQSYVYTIAQNQVYNYFRQLASNETLISSLVSNTADHFLDGQVFLEKRETAALLQKAVDQLPPKRKQVFQLCKLEGRSYEEVAKIMGITAATVNTHMTKSLQSLKLYLIDNQFVSILLLTSYAIKVLSHP